MFEGFILILFGFACYSYGFFFASKRKALWILSLIGVAVSYILSVI